MRKWYIGFREMLEYKYKVTRKALHAKSLMDAFTWDYLYDNGYTSVNSLILKQKIERYFDYSFDFLIEKEKGNQGNPNYHKQKRKDGAYNVYSWPKKSKAKRRKYPAYQQMIKIAARAHMRREGFYPPEVFALIALTLVTRKSVWELKDLQFSEMLFGSRHIALFDKVNNKVIIPRRFCAPLIDIYIQNGGRGVFDIYDSGLSYQTLLRMCDKVLSLTWKKPVKSQPKYKGYWLRCRSLHHARGKRRPYIPDKFPQNNAYRYGKRNKTESIRIWRRLLLHKEIESHYDRAFMRFKAIVKIYGLKYAFTSKYEASKQNQHWPIEVDQFALTPESFRRPLRRKSAY